MTLHAVIFVVVVLGLPNIPATCTKHLGTSQQQAQGISDYLTSQQHAQSNLGLPNIPATCTKYLRLRNIPATCTKYLWNVFFWDNFMYCYTETEVADQTYYFTQSQYTDTRPWQKLQTKFTVSPSHSTQTQGHDRSCRSNLPSHPVTVYRHYAKTDAADQTYHLTQSQYTNTRPRQKLQIKLTISPSHSTQTLGQPVFALTPKCWCLVGYPLEYQFPSHRQQMERIRRGNSKQFVH